MTPKWTSNIQFKNIKYVSIESGTNPSLLPVNSDINKLYFEENVDKYLLLKL